MRMTQKGLSAKISKEISAGFTAIEGLLILLVLAIIGGTGYYVWHSKQQTDKTYNNAAQAQSNIPKITTIKTFAECQKAPGSKIQESYPEVCVTTAGKKFTNPAQPTYLTIKEWGVRFKLNSVINDAYYTYNKKIQSVYLSLSSLKNTQCAADKTAQGAIGRYSPDEIVDLPPPTNINKIGTKVGDYYFLEFPSQAMCSTDKSIQAKADAARSTFAGILNTLTTL